MRKTTFLVLVTPWIATLSVQAIVRSIYGVSMSGAETLLVITTTYLIHMIMTLDAIKNKLTEANRGENGRD